MSKPRHRPWRLLPDLPGGVADAARLPPQALQPGSVPGFLLRIASQDLVPRALMSPA